MNLAFFPQPPCLRRLFLQGRPEEVRSLISKFRVAEKEEVSFCHDLVAFTGDSDSMS